MFLSVPLREIMLLYSTLQHWCSGYFWHSAILGTCEKRTASATTPPFRPREQAELITHRGRSALALCYARGKSREIAPRRADRRTCA